MLSHGTLTIPRRLIPAVMLLAAGGTPPVAGAVDELERSGVMAHGVLDPAAADLVAVMTDPDLVVSVEVATRDGSQLSTVWATDDRAVWGRSVEVDIYQLRLIDALSVPLLLAQLTGVGRRPEAPFSGSVTIAAETLAAAVDWHTDDPETACGILVAAGVDSLWADRILIALHHQRATWTVSSVWSDGASGHEVHEVTVLDAGPAGYWRLTSPDSGDVTYTVTSLRETVRLLRRCVPSRIGAGSPEGG